MRKNTFTYTSLMTDICRNIHLHVGTDTFTTNVAFAQDELFFGNNVHLVCITANGYQYAVNFDYVSVYVYDGVKHVSMFDKDNTYYTIALDDDFNIYSLNVEIYDSLQERFLGINQDLFLKSCAFQLQQEREYTAEMSLV